MKRHMRLIALSLILITILSACSNREISNLSSGEVTISDSVKVGPIKAIEGATAIPYEYDSNFVMQSLFKENEHFVIEKEDGFISYTANVSSLSLDDNQLFFITNNIKPIHKIFQYSEPELFTLNELSFKSSKAVLQDIELLITSYGLNIHFSKLLSLDIDSLSTAQDIILKDEELKNLFINDNGTIGYSQFDEAYYCEFDIYINDYPISDEKYYNFHRYQFISPAKACAMVTSNGLEYLNIYGALTIKSEGSENTYSPNVALDYLKIRQNRLTNVKPITITEIVLKYAPDRIGGSDSIFELKPVWSVTWHNNDMGIGHTLVDAKLGFEIV